jgi:hypothetical protein
VSHTDAERQALDGARQAYETARRTRFRRQAERAAAADALAAAVRTIPPGNPERQQAEEALARAGERLR